MGLTFEYQRIKTKEQSDILFGFVAGILCTAIVIGGFILILI